MSRNKVTVTVEMEDGVSITVRGGWLGANPYLHNRAFRAEVERLSRQVQGTMIHAYGDAYPLSDELAKYTHPELGKVSREV